MVLVLTMAKIASPVTVIVVKRHSSRLRSLLRQTVVDPASVGQK